MNEARLKELANKILALRDGGLPKPRNSKEKEYQTAVLSLCREITIGPIDAPFGQITVKDTVMGEQ
jgi:hypothetical protein